MILLFTKSTEKGVVLYLLKIIKAEKIINKFKIKLGNSLKSIISYSPINS